MRKDVKELIDRYFTTSTYIRCPNYIGLREFKTYSLKHIIITFFDIQIISDDEKNHPYRPSGMYWSANPYTESGEYFLANKRKYQKQLEKIIIETRKEYHKLKGYNSVNFKKISPKHLLNYLEYMKIADQKIDLIWKKITNERKLKDIEADFT